MKKLFVLSLIFLLVSGLGACAGEKNQSAEQELIISLDANKTTGYEWKSEISDKSIISVTDEYKVDAASDGAIGVGGKHSFYIKGLKPGKTVLTLSYQRSWEDAPIKSIVYELEVLDNLRVIKLSENLKENS